VCDGFVSKVRVALHEKWFLQLIDSSLRSLRISVISALNISRDYSYAEITEIRRDRRRGLQIPNRDYFRAKLVRVMVGQCQYHLR
jgi:hypothetical protein